MKTKITSLVIVMILLKLQSIFGQTHMEEQTELFSNRVDNPIQIEVLDKGNNIVFYAYNRSLYPYQVILDFKNIQNLFPNDVHNKYIVSPGRSNLLTLSVIDKNLQHNYTYSYKSTIGDPNKKPELDYPYLIPISKSKSVNPCFKNEPKSFFRDCFNLNKGDTVFCMRKGEVTAVPDMFHEADKISRHKSLEIRHSDGTVLIYENINPDHFWVKLGQTAFPGQPLGVINDDLALKIFLYSFQVSTKLNRMKIHYFIKEGQTVLFSDSLKNVEIKHPIEIITKEMTKREQKKLKITNRTLSK